MKNAKENEGCGCPNAGKKLNDNLAVTDEKSLQPKSLLASDSVSYAYDSRGRLHTVTFQNGTVITYSYDSCGNRTSVVTTCPGGTC